MIRFAFAGVVLLLFSGCFKEPAPSEEENLPNPSSSATYTKSDSATTTSEQSGPPVEKNLHLTNCEGVGAIASIADILMAVEAPSGWNRRHLADQHIAVYDCERVLVGPFERGPVTIMHEWYENAEPVGDCGVGEYDRLVLLQHFWFSDHDIAEYLNTTYSFPARFGTFSFESEQIATGSQSTWSFGVPSGPISYLEVRNVTASDGPTGTFFQRWVWLNQFGGVSYLDYRFEYTNDQYSAAVSGQLRSPTAWASSGIEDYAGTGGPHWDYEASGEFFQFRDFECKQPV